MYLILFALWRGPRQFFAKQPMRTSGGTEGWKHTLIWRVCVAERGMIFRGFSLEQGIQFYY